MSYSPATIRSIIELCADDPLYFGKVVAPNFYKKDFATFHRHMIRRINNLPPTKKLIVVEVPRGNAKTKIVSVLNPLHRCLFASGKKERLHHVVIASCSEFKATEIISDYKAIIKSSNFQGIFPGTRLAKDREDLIEVENTELNISFRVLARGRNSQFTGLSFGEFRPQIFVADDLEDPNQAYNQRIVDENQNLIDEVVMFGLDPDGYGILVGTPFATDCFTERFTKRKNVVVIKYPQLVETEEMSIELGVPIGNSIWEDLWPTAKVQKEKEDAIADDTIDAWMRQRQLNTDCGAGQVRFDMSKVGRISEDERAAYFKDKKLNIYILSDYAYSKKIYADESAILVFGVDDMSNYYILHSDKGKWGDVGTTEKIVGLVRAYQKDLKLVGVEARGYGFIERRMLEVKRELNIGFPVVPLEPKNKAKSARIKNMISYVEDGRIFFVGEHKKLESELKTFRGEEREYGDDLSDAFAYIPDVAAKPTTQKTIDEKQKEQAHKQWVNFCKEMDERRAPVRMVRSVHEDRYY